MVVVGKREGGRQRRKKNMAPVVAEDAEDVVLVLPHALSRGIRC